MTCTLVTPFTSGVLGLGCIDPMGGILDDIERADIGSNTVHELGGDDGVFGHIISSVCCYAVLCSIIPFQGKLVVR